MSVEEARETVRKASLGLHRAWSWAPATRSADDQIVLWCRHDATGHGIFRCLPSGCGLPAIIAAVEETKEQAATVGDG